MLMSDGTVEGSNLEAFFPQESIDEIFSWDGIVQIETYDAGIIGLRRDGRVVAVKNPNDPHYADYEYEDIVKSTQGWQKVKKLILSGGGLYALTYDGDILVPGKLIKPMFAEYQDWDYTQWSDLKDLISYGSPQGSGLFGLKRNGKILCRYSLIQGERETNLPKFEEEPRNVVAIDSSEFLFVCLKADGTVLVAGSEAYYDSFRKEIRDLSNVAQVLALNSSVAVRFDDGTVKVINCYDDYSALDTEEVSSWQDICQIYTNRYQLFALDKNGRVHVADNNEKIGNLDKSNIEGWKNIDEMTVYGTFYGESYMLAWQSNGTLLTEGLSGLPLFYP